MPQMAPLNWVSLYFYFSFLLLITIIVIYYSFLYKPSISKSKFFKKNNFWKW